MGAPCLVERLFALFIRAKISGQGGAMKTRRA